MVQHSSYTDVLIIGAGPSGLMAAQALARLGIAVKVVDQREQGTQYGNADGLQPRTLEIWKSYGILDNFSTHAAAMHALVCYESGKDGIKRSVPSQNIVVHSRYPYELTASIETIEAILHDSMKVAGAQIIQPVYPLSIDFLPETSNSGNEVLHPVKVVLQHLPPRQAFPPSPGPSNGHQSLGGDFGTHVAAEKEIIYAKYVLGADGANSWVRRHLGIPMEGDQTEYVWGVTDVAVATDFPDCHFKCVIQSSKGAVLIAPREEEKIRIYVQLSPQDSIKTPEGRLNKSISPDVIQNKVLETIREALYPYRIDFRHVFWCTIFSVPQKVAARYSANGRVFIVGDACHTHSPNAGQGANASMGDSHNLAWKIAYVLRGWAGKSLLDTYEIERRTYAQELIAFDKRIARSLNGETAAHYRNMLHQQNMFTSGNGVLYKSRLTDASPNLNAPYLKAGERLPPSPIVRLGDWQPMDLQDLVPSDGVFKLFIFACDILQADNEQRLSQFADALEQIMCPETTERIHLYTILNGSKEDIHWKNVPPFLQSWKRVFVSEEIGVHGAYSRFGISSEGAIIFVRPDGYISTITGLSGTNASQITTFLRGL